MVHDDSGWRPKGGESYKGYQIWEYDIGAHEINNGEVDGDIEFPEELKERVKETGNDED